MILATTFPTFQEHVPRRPVSDIIYDIAVIGGGINGCGIARDAAGRGLTVLLCECGDLGAATSSASTKLIHGGLRYLEYGKLRLVREALAEREVLLRAAPHIIRPLRLLLPHQSGLRPRWLLRLGLLVYDHLGRGHTLPPTRSIELRNDPAGRALKPDFEFAFEYSDCRVDDARLVILNALDARARGATIRSRTRCVAAECQAGLWNLTLECADTAARWSATARVLINASGPWIGSVMRQVIGSRRPAPVRLVKGSHIVVKRLFEHDRAYMLQNPDGRLVFAIPYERDFTLIGTTEQDYAGDPSAAAADASEISYLCETISSYFRTPIGPDAVVWTYSGVRPLYDDGASKAQQATRDYVLELDAPQDRAPLLNILGGKITTYRRLAEAALARLAPYLPMRGPWTATAQLPGGDLEGCVGELRRSLQATYPALGQAHVERFIQSYGTRALLLEKYARRPGDLGQRFGHDLTEAEVAYLMHEEWAYEASDVLWRRTKLGLWFGAADASRLDSWMARNRAAVAAA